jgi:hypothetical protein
MQEEAILDLFAYGEWLPRFMADTGTAWKNMEPEDVPEWFDQVGMSRPDSEGHVRGGLSSASSSDPRDCSVLK